MVFNATFNNIWLTRITTISIVTHQSFSNYLEKNPFMYMCISGRRVCLGESLARMEFFLFFTAIVSRFRIVPIEGEQPPKIEGKVGTTYSPVTYKVRFVDW